MVPGLESRQSTHINPAPQPPPSFHLVVPLTIKAFRQNVLASRLASAPLRRGSPFLIYEVFGVSRGVPSRFPFAFDIPQSFGVFRIPLERKKTYVPFPQTCGGFFFLPLVVHPPSVNSPVFFLNFSLHVGEVHDSSKWCHLPSLGRLFILLFDFERTNGLPLI